MVPRSAWPVGGGRPARRPLLALRRRCAARGRVLGRGRGRGTSGAAGRRLPGHGPRAAPGSRLRRRAQPPRRRRRTTRAARRRGAADAANGAERAARSLPYQNSVVSLDGRAGADDPRRDRQHDLVLVAVGALGAEQPAEDRQVAEPRDVRGVALVAVLDQPAEHLASRRP